MPCWYAVGKLFVQDADAIDFDETNDEWIFYSISSVTYLYNDKIVHCVWLVDRFTKLKRTFCKIFIISLRFTKLEDKKELGAILKLKNKRTTDPIYFDYDGYIAIFSRRKYRKKSKVRVPFSPTNAQLWTKAERAFC